MIEVLPSPKSQAQVKRLLDEVDPSVKLAVNKLELELKTATGGGQTITTVLQAESVPQLSVTVRQTVKLPGAA